MPFSLFKINQHINRLPNCMALSIRVHIQGIAVLGTAVTAKVCAQHPPDIT